MSKLLCLLFGDLPKFSTNQNVFSQLLNHCTQHVKQQEYLQCLSQINENYRKNAVENPTKIEY